MASISSIAQSGMNAAQMTLNSSAHNIANMNTTGFRRQEVLQTSQADGGVSTALTTARSEGAKAVAHQNYALQVFPNENVGDVVHKSVQRDGF